MSFVLTSSCGIKAACAQWEIKGDEPVKLTLWGPRSYCCANAIKNVELKDVLAVVGNVFEKTINSPFFTVTHTFQRREIDDNKNDGNGQDLVENHERQVNAIFNFIQESVLEQTKHDLQLDLNQVSNIRIEKTQDNEVPAGAYAITITLSEAAAEAAEAAGLVFQAFGNPDNPENEIASSAYAGMF